MVAEHSASLHVEEYGVACQGGVRWIPLLGEKRCRPKVQSQYTWLAWWTSTKGLTMAIKMPSRIEYLMTKEVSRTIEIQLPEKIMTLGIKRNVENGKI